MGTVAETICLGCGEKPHCTRPHLWRGPRPSIIQWLGQEQHSFLVVPAAGPISIAFPAQFHPTFMDTRSRQPYTC